MVFDWLQVITLMWNTLR